MYEIYLKKNEEKRLEYGESLVYANEVFKTQGKDKNGSLACVYSYDHKFIGKGYINHLSKVLVRIISRDKDAIDNYDFFYKKINDANNYRKEIGYTDSYRAFYSESDELPGLIVDKYSDYLSIEISSLGLELKKDLIVDVLKDIFKPKGIYEKVEMNLREKEGLKDTSGILYGDIPDEVIINENGLKISVDIKNGQKTGYFLDQKENRFAIRKYTKNKDVLDCFSNTGGFSVNAALNAKSVIAIDISKRATDNVLRNAESNGLNNIEVITDDVFNVLRKFKNEGKKFDCIILDPPAFTKSVSEVKDALRGYKDINTLALKLINENGYLISSSCSHYISLNLFQNMLKESMIQAKKKCKIVEIKTQAPDHYSLLELNDNMYLKFFVLKVESLD